MMQCQNKKRVFVQVKIFVFSCSLVKQQTTSNCSFGSDFDS